MDNLQKEEMYTLTEKEAPPMWEDISARGANRKIYTKDGRLKEAVYFSSPVHIQTDDGSYQDPAAMQLVSEDAYYQTTQGVFKARFNQKGDNGQLMRIEKDGCILILSALERGRRKTCIPDPKVQQNGGLLYKNITSGTDYLYYVESDRVKENIVIQEKNANSRYGFILETEGLKMRFDEQERTLTFSSLESGLDVFTIPAPFMTDAAGNHSDNVYYEVHPVTNARSTLVVIPDSDWLEAEERTFPVTIDPQVVLAANTSMSTYQWKNGIMTAVGGLIPVGNVQQGSNCFSSRMYIKLDMPQIPGNPRIQKATLELHQAKAYGSGNLHLCLYQANGDIFPGVCTPKTGDTMLDWAPKSVQGSADYSFDITAIYDSMLHGETSYANLMLCAEYESGEDLNYADIYGAPGSYAPKITVTYENGYATNMVLGTTHDLGAFGRATIELQSGMLSIESEDMEWLGNRMPVSIRHTYSSALAGQQYTNNPAIDLHTADFHAMHLGNGWRLNYMQSVMPKTFLHEGTQRNGYVYTDESGAQMYLIESTKFYFKREPAAEECGETYYLYEDLDDSGYLYDPVKREIYHCAETYIFDAAGRLVTIRDQNDNTIQMVYTAGKLTSIMDGAGRVFELDWGSSGALTSITAPDGNQVQYQYTGDNLTSVIARDGTITKLDYTANRLTAVSMYDGVHSWYKYKIVYTYDSSGRIQKVQEVGQGDINGQSAFYTYNIASRKTTVKNTVDNAEKLENVTTVYTFDNDGSIRGSFAYVNKEDKVQVTPSGSGINPYTNGMHYIANGSNLLTNHRFSSTNGWSPFSGVCSSFSRSIVTNQTMAPYGKTMLSLNSSSREATGDGVYQLTNILATGEYTFSAFLKLLSDTSGSVNDTGVFLRVTDTSDNILAESERLTKADSGFIRLVLPFTLTTSQSVKVWICTRGKASTYVNAPQLEKNSFAGPYNLIENGGFERTYTGWTRSSGTSHTTLDSFTGKGALRIAGSLTQDQYAYQDIPVKTGMGVRETFTLSGWAKASSLPKKGATTDPKFQLAAKILYTDNTFEEYTADFSSSTDEWQPATVTFAKEAYKTVNKIQIYCRYGFESGYALFDDIQLISNSCETGLRAEDFFVDTSKPDPDEGEEEVSEETPGFEEVYDYYGNPITDTQFTDGEYGTIYRSMEYNTDDPSTLANDAGNDLTAETDPRGYKTYYDAKPSNSHAVCITDRCGICTEYSYDNAGRIDSMLVLDPESEASVLADLAFSYNARGNIASIRRQDEQNYIEYTMDYNRFFQLSSIGITRYDKLVDLTYNDSGRLKTIAYPRDGQVSYVYNRYGQVISETWTKNNVVTDKYRYVYDAFGNVIRYIDICQRIEYTYTYTRGTINRIVISAIFLDDNEVITSRAKKHTINCTYNEKGTLTSKIIRTAYGTEQTYTYVATDKNQRVVTLPTGAVCQSGLDHLGRKTFDEIELGSGYLSRQFTYLPGKITAEHQAYDKVKSAPTTNLVDTITYADGRTIRYQYDPEERITKVTDSVEGITEYTYDALGQLITEKKNGVATTIICDSAGNILSKGGKTYTYDDTYVDLLTSYNGESISYGTGINKSLNPIQYRGFAMTWTKGRQLASASGNGKTMSFTYDPKGIRTSKTVNGIKHDYLLEGTKLLRDGYTGAFYLYDNEEQVCGMVYQNQAYYFCKNLQGDVIVITDAKGAVIARYSYDAWGVCTITGLTELGATVANKNLFRYRSYIYDADLNLYYLQSRYYDPETGRFINGDEVRYLGIGQSAASYNLFAYCTNDPINHYDLYGMAPTRVGVLYMDTSHSELLNQLKATVDSYFGHNLIYERYRTIGNFNLFKKGWETVKNCDVIIIDLHASPERLVDDQGRVVLTALQARSLPNIKAKAVFLNCCNAGHYDYRGRNIALTLSFHICGSLFASDGTVYFGYNPNLYDITFSSVGDETWENLCKAASPRILRKKNYGWMRYEHLKSPKLTSRDVQYSTTFPRFMNYLKRNGFY